MLPIVVKDLSQEVCEGNVRLGQWVCIGYYFWCGREPRVPSRTENEVRGGPLEETSCGRYASATRHGAESGLRCQAMAARREKI
jgi:hypothetical protein